MCVVQPWLQLFLLAFWWCAAGLVLFCGRMVLGIITMLQTLCGAMCATGCNPKGCNTRLLVTLDLQFFFCIFCVWPLFCLTSMFVCVIQVSWDARNMSLQVTREQWHILPVILNHPKHNLHSTKHIPPTQMPWTCCVMKLFWSGVHLFITPHWMTNLYA